MPDDLHPPPRCGTQVGSNMSHVALVRLVEPMTSDSLASLIHQQMTRRIEAMPWQAAANLGRSARSGEWETLVEELWRMAVNALMGKAPSDCLPWTCAAAPVALLRELEPA